MISYKGLFRLALLLALPALPAASQEKPKPSQPPSETVAVERLNLDQLVAQALRVNPEIQAAERRVEALDARVPQARALPDPTVSAGWMGEPIPFVVKSSQETSYRGVSAMETFPFPGKRKLRGKIADRESRAAWWEYEATKRRVVSEVKVAYFRYAYLDTALAITENNRTLLEKLTQIAEARYETGKGAQQDVLKGQVELSQLLESITILREQREIATARINTLLDRSPETPLSPAEPLARTPLRYTLAELYRLARTNDTGIQGDERVVERDKDAVALARKSYYPDFSVSAMYQRMPGGPNMYGGFIGVDIPIFYKSKQRQEVYEASRTLAGDRSVQEDRETTVNYLVKEQYLDAQQAQKLMLLYDQAIVPQSSETLAASEMEYETGKVDFLTLLDNFTNLLDFRLHDYREISDYQIALARLEPLVGVTLAQ